MEPGNIVIGSVGQAFKRLDQKEFALFQRLLRNRAGIHLGTAKMALVQSRLAKRLRQFNLDSYGDYFNLITSGSAAAELQVAIDLLTTNETHFFREPAHFDYFKGQVLPSAQVGRPFRVWSAACSSGEEPYSIAMVLADRFDLEGWEVVASDISTRVLEKAGRAQYPLERSAEIPREYLLRYCLKGGGRQAGTFIVAPELAGRVQFMQVNLNEALPWMGAFDVVFLRNVMIYFDLATKQQVLKRIIPLLKPTGYLFIGHSETLNGVTNELHPIQPAIYQAAATFCETRD